MYMRKLLALLTVSLLFAGSLFAQKTITGKVSDDKGNPIPNASVMIKGTNSGTVTKADGIYSVNVPKNATAFIFSSVVMATVEMKIGSSSEIDVSLNPEDKILTDVVVVGYGTQKRKEVTGSMASVKGGSVSNK